MSSKVVAMVALKAPVTRGAQRRADLSHLPYARATWEWWCARHGVEFVLVERTPGDDLLPTAPATILRWFAPAQILGSRPKGTQVLLVDADTMIRWDTPDFFAGYDGRLGAAPGLNRAWIRTTLAAFQPLFPGVTVPPARYFNAGLILAGSPQLDLFAKFGDLCAARAREIEQISRAGNFGTDQTPLNFLVRQEKHRVRLLPRAFNLLYCFGWRDVRLRMEYETGSTPDWSTFEAKAFGHERAFAFVNWGYIWHFTNTVASRTRVMAETWKRVRHHYR